MALKVGSLYVSLSANTSGLIKGFAEAAKATEKVAKEIKKVSNDVAMGAAGFTAIGAAAMKMAASVDGSAKKSMDGLEKSMQLVAVQVADIIKPAVDALSKSFGELAGYVAGLDPETKKSIATFATWAAGIAVAAKVLGTVSGLVSTLSGALSGIAGIIGTVGFGPLVLGLAAAAAGIAALHYAWRNNVGGMADAWKTFVEWTSGVGSSLYDSLVKFATKWIDRMLGGLREITFGLAKMHEVMGNDSAAREFKALSDSFEQMRMSFVTKGLEGIVVEAINLGKEAANGFVGEWKRIFDEMGVSKLFDFKKGAARAPVAAGDAPAEVGTMETSSLSVMKFVSELQTQASIASEATDKIAVEFSKAVGDAVSAEAHQKAIADAAAAAAAHAAKMRAQLKATLGIVTQNSGALGQTISNITQGAQAGGPWGAIIAAVMEIFQRMASWKSLMDIFEKGLKRLGEFLEPLLSQIFDIVGTFSQLGTEILAPLFKAFKPLFDAVGAAMRRLMPVFTDLGRVFDALGPLIELAIRFGEQFSALGPIMDLIAGVVKLISTVLMAAMVWINSLLAAFGNEAAAAEAERLKGVLQKMWSGVDEHMAVPAMEMGDTLADTSGSLTDLAVAADKVSESLTNVPAGYRVALARYNADFGASPGWSGSPPPPPPTNVTINGDIITDADSISALADDAVAEAKRRAGQLHGNPFGGGKP